MNQPPKDRDGSAANQRSVLRYFKKGTLLNLVTEPSLIMLFSFLIFLSFLGGCATTPEIAPQPEKAVFYPSAPEEPRLQFLTSFSSSNDLEGPPSAFRRFIVGNETSEKPIVKPYGVVVHKNKIYICDTVLNSIDILDLESRKFEYFRSPGQYRLIEPINLAFDQDDNMYVADSRQGQVAIFDKNKNYSGTIGKSSEFKPTAVLIKEDKIYICDLKSHSIKVFELKDKQYLFSFPSEEGKEEAKLFSPTNMTIDEEGNIYVSDTGAFRVQKYNSKGEFIKTIGSHGDAVGQFSRPKGVAVDKEQRVYVVDAAFENVQIFDKEGKPLLFFAQPGTPAASILPAGIAIDYSLKNYFLPLVDSSFEIEYLVLVTNQYGDKKLNIFGFGHKKL